MWAWYGPWTSWSIRRTKNYSEVTFDWPSVPDNMTSSITLTSGHVRLILGDYDAAQTLYLQSGSPVEALHMRRDLLHWDQVSFSWIYIDKTFFMYAKTFSGFAFIEQTGPERNSLHLERIRATVGVHWRLLGVFAALWKVKSIKKHVGVINSWTWLELSSLLCVYQGNPSKRPPWIWRGRAQCVLLGGNRPDVHQMRRRAQRSRYLQVSNFRTF